jgi:CHAD domain-containing protein
MAFSFEPQESPAAAIRRIGLEQLAALRADLHVEPQPDVHEARKRTKMLRAMLDLARRGLDPQLRRHESARLRDLSRSLGPVRDAEVRLATMRHLLEFGAGKPPPAFAPLLRALQKAALASAHRTFSKRTLSAARRAIREAEAVWGRLKFTASGWSLIEPGLRRSWRESREGLFRFLEQPDVETIHEWRKAVKTLWYHLRVLRRLRPQPITCWAEAFGTIGELLGDDHDLAILADFIRENHSASKAARPALDLIARRRADLQQVIPGIASPLLIERPGDFAARMHRWWRAWRK